MKLTVTGGEAVYNAKTVNTTRTTFCSFFHRLRGITFKSPLPSWCHTSSGIGSYSEIITGINFLEIQMQVGLQFGLFI